MTLTLHGTNGITYPDGKVQLGAAALEQVGMITHTSDTALGTQGAGGTQMGAAVSMTVPAAGAIRVTIVELEVDETEGNTAAYTIGLKVGGDAILWAVLDASNGTSEFVPSPSHNASTASILTTNAWAMCDPETGGTGPASLIFTWDIVGRGMTAGAGKDIEVWLADNVTSRAGELTVTGTTVSARFLVEIIDGS